MSRQNPTIGSCALLVGLMLAVATPRAGAQTQDEFVFDEAKVRADMDRVLRERDRVRMADGVPSSSVGLEQDGNDMRSRTPALANSDRLTVKLDADDHYQRALALYSDKARFTTPPVASEAPVRESSRASRIVSVPGAEHEEEAAESHLAFRVLFTAAAAILAAVGIFAWKRTSAAAAAAATSSSRKTP